MQGLLRWQTEDGPVIVEVDLDEGARDGFRSVALPKFRRGEIVDVPGRLEGALDHARVAAKSALRAFRHPSMGADEISLEFGIKLNAEAGAVVARTSAEAHMTVRVNWKRHAGGTCDGGEDDGVNEGEEAPPEAAELGTSGTERRGDATAGR